MIRTVFISPNKRNLNNFSLIPSPEINRFKTYFLFYHECHMGVLVSIIERLVDAIAKLNVGERAELFKIVEDRPKLWHSAGYVLLSKKEFDLLAALNEENAQAKMWLLQKYVELAKSVRNRNRSPNPKTVERNIRICDLHRSGDWSHQALALEFGMKRQSIANILKGEERWRKLAKKSS